MALVSPVSHPIADTETKIDHSDTNRQVVFRNERGYASVGEVEAIVNADVQQVYNALVREDLPPTLRFVKERTKYKLLRADPVKGIKVYDAEYKANYKVATYTWQGAVNFHIEQNQPRNAVTMRLSKPGFLQRLEISFNMRELTDGLTAISVEQKLKPSMPTWDPISKQIVKNINKGLLLDTLADTIQHVEKVKDIALPEAENTLLNRFPSFNLPNLPNLPRVPSLGGNLALQGSNLDRQDSSPAA